MTNDFKALRETKVKLNILLRSEKRHLTWLVNLAIKLEFLHLPGKLHDISTWTDDNFFLLRVTKVKI